MELQSRYSDLTKRGLGLIAVSYDSPDILKKFADSRGITFPMVSDQGSVIIKRYELINESIDRTSRQYGVPHPGTFILDRKGVVTARYFEDAYQERNTVASIFVREANGTSSGSVLKSETSHLEIVTSLSDSVAAPGTRLSLAFDVKPKKNMHVYAPGKHDYRVIGIALNPQPWLRVHPTTYPSSQIHHFKPLNERVEAYSKPFRLVQDATIQATPEIQKLLAGVAQVTLGGTVEYQACDERVCYTPASIPFNFVLTMKPLDRKPAGQ